MLNAEQIRKGVALILEGAGLGDWAEDPNLADTPRRVASMYMELFGSVEVSEKKIEEILKVQFPSKLDEMVAFNHIQMYCLCPHHLLPVDLDVSVGYIPQSKRVIGASKVTRLVQVLSRRPVLQETLTNEIVDYIHKYVKPLGVGVVVQGFHSCMSVRGVRQRDEIMTTSALRGNFKDNPETRREFLDLVYSVNGRSKG